MYARWRNTYMCISLSVSLYALLPTQALKIRASALLLPKSPILTTCFVFLFFLIPTQALEIRARASFFFFSFSLTQALEIRARALMLQKFFESQRLCGCNWALLFSFFSVFLAHRRLRYGRGLYFSKVSSKANDYADATERQFPHGTFRAMFLCKVALGESLRNADVCWRMLTYADVCWRAYVSIRRWVIYHSCMCRLYILLYTLYTAIHVPL